MIAVGYVRVSGHEQAENGTSLEAQEQSIRAYSDAQGWSLRRVYVDAAVPGSLEASARPALAELLSELGDASRVVCAMSAAWVSSMAAHACKRVNGPCNREPN